MHPKGFLGENFKHHMSYFLFSPPGFLKEVYRTYLLFSKFTYEFFISKVFLKWVTKETINIICCIIFSLFPTGFKGVLATYHTHYSPHIFPTGFLEELLKIIYAYDQDKDFQNYTRKSKVCKEYKTHKKQLCARGSVRVRL